MTSRLKWPFLHPRQYVAPRSLSSLLQQGSLTARLELGHSLQAFRSLSEEARRAWRDELGQGSPFTDVNTSPENH